MMRRKKDTQLDGKELVTLPKKTIELRELEFSQEERDICRLLSPRPLLRVELTSSRLPSQTRSSREGARLYSTSA